MRLQVLQRRLAENGLSKEEREEVEGDNQKSKEVTGALVIPNLTEVLQLP